MSGKGPKERAGENPYARGNPLPQSSAKKKSGQLKKSALVEASKKKGVDKVEGPRIEDLLSTAGSTELLLSRNPMDLRLEVARSRGETSPRGLGGKGLVPMLEIAAMGGVTEEQGESKAKLKLRRDLAASRFLSQGGIGESVLDDEDDREELVSGIYDILEASQSPRPTSGRRDLQNRTLQDELVSPRPNTGFLTTTGLKAVLGKKRGAATDLHHQGISTRGDVNFAATLQQQQGTPPKSGTKPAKKQSGGVPSNLYFPPHGTVTPAPRSSSSKKPTSAGASSKKTPIDPRVLEQREREDKEMLVTLMRYIDGLGDQAWEMIDTKTLGVIDTREAVDELNRLAVQASDQREIDAFGTSLQSSGMAKAERRLRDSTKAAAEDMNTHAQGHNRTLAPVSESAKEKHRARVALADLLKTQPSIEEQILRFRIRNHPALRTLHQAIQRSKWLNIIFDPAITTIEVGAERNRLHADICRQEASERSKFNIGLTYEEIPALEAMRTREESAIRKKLDDLRILIVADRNNQVATVRTLTYRAMVKESEKYRNEEEARRARIAARREDLSRKVDENRSVELVLERSKAAVEFVRSFEIDAEGGQIDKKRAAKQKLIDLNRAIETEFIIGRSVPNSDPALVLKDFSEEMSHPLLTPIFQAYATTKWLELRYQSTGPVTVDANFKKMEDLISGAPFSDRSNLDREELAELGVLVDDFNARTLRAFKTTILEACQGKIISTAAREKMKPPVTNLALVTFKLEAKESAKKKKEAIQKRQKEEADEASARQEQQMKDQLDGALLASTEDLKIVRDQLLTLKNDYKQGLETRQNLFPTDTLDQMLRKLNTEIESGDGKGLLSPRKAQASPRISLRVDFLSPTIGQTFLTGFLKPDMDHPSKLAKLKEIENKLKQTQPLLQEEIDRLRLLESERENALKAAVENLNKVHAKLVTLKKPPYNKDAIYRRKIIEAKLVGEDDTEVVAVFDNVNRDDLPESDQIDENELNLGGLNVLQLKEIAKKATEVAEEIDKNIGLIEEAREFELKKETDKALEKLTEVRDGLQILKGDPYDLNDPQRNGCYSGSFTASDSGILKDLFDIVNTTHIDEASFIKDVLDPAVDTVQRQNPKTPHESKIAFLQKTQAKSEQITPLLEAAIRRLQQERRDELGRLMQRAADEMAPLHKIKKLLNELGVTDKNLLDADLHRLIQRHDPSVEAVLSFYKEADLEKDGKEQALETLKEAVVRQETFAHKKTLLLNIATTVKAAFDKLNQELDRAQKEIARKRNDELKDRGRAAINALKDVRTKLVDLKTDHAIGLPERGELMAAKLVGAVDLTPIFTEINKNVGETGQAEVEQNWEKLLADAVDRELASPPLATTAEIHQKKIEFFEKLEARAKEVEEGLVAAIDSKLTAQQVARRQELDLSKDDLLGDFEKIREKLETLKNPYQELVAQRGELYPDRQLKSPTLLSIFTNINGNVGEPNAEGVAAADKVADILDNKIEAEKNKASTTDELDQHKSAMKWIGNTKAKTAIADKALQDEIDRRSREVEEEEKRQRELKEEADRKIQIKEAGKIFKTSDENALDALSRVHGRLNRLKNAPHDRLPQSREELFLPTLSGTNPTVSSVFQNVNAGVEGLQGKPDSDIRSAITRHLNEALRSLDSDILMTENSPAAAHDKRMKFLTSAPIYCDEVTTKAGQIEELLKAAELEKLKDLAAASLLPLDAAKKELAALEVENFSGLLEEGLPIDGANDSNAAAINQVRKFYQNCNVEADLTEIAEAKRQIEAELAVDFEEKVAVLQAIPLRAAEALGVLEGQKREKEAQNQSIENAVTSLLSLHQAKQGLENPVSNLDGLRDPNNPLALEAVKKFYKEADATNGTQETIKRYIAEALASQENASFAEKQKFLDAIPEIVEGALNALRKSAKEREMERLINAAADSLVPIHAAKARLAAFPPNDLALLDTLVNPDPRILANVPALEMVKHFYINAVIDGSQDKRTQARYSILRDPIMADIADLDDDGIFEKMKEFLRAIPPMAELAARSLERVADTKETFAKVSAGFANNVILNGLANDIATNLVLIHKAKKGLKQRDENLLDTLAALDGEVQGQRAVDLVRKFYKDADVAEGAKNPNEQALDALKRDVVNSALTFEEKQELLKAIPAVVGRAVEMLNKVKEVEELTELLEAAADSLEPIHEAKKGLKDQGFDWLKDLAPEGDETEQAVELVKKFYRDAVVAEAPKPQALKMLQEEVMADEGPVPEEKKKLLQAVIDVAGRANLLLSDAKEVEEQMALENAVIESLIPIHTVKRELTRIRAYNRDLLKDLPRDNLLAVDMVRQFYQNLDVFKEAEEQARISLQVALQDLDPTTQRKLIIDVPVIAEEAVTILRKALQQSKEYAKAENLELAAAVEAMNKVRKKLIVLKDGHRVSLDERGELLQRNFRDGERADLEALFHGLNSGVAEIGESVSVENTKEMINLAIPLPLGEITQQGKHAAAIEFLAALKIKAAKIEQDLQREIEARAALKTQERDALKSMGDLYDTMESLQSSHGIDAPQRLELFPPVNSRNQKYEGVFEELNSSVGGSGDGSAKTAATKHSMQVELEKILSPNTESLSDFYTSVKSRADEINAALARKLLIEQQRPSRSGGAMSQVDFIYPSFTRIIESSRSERDNIFYPPVEGVTYNRCRPVLKGVTEVQQETIDDKFDFVTTKRPEDLSQASKVKSEISELMARANGVLRGKQRDAGLTEQEMAIAILLSIKHGGIMSDATDSGAVINDLKKVLSFGEEEEEHEKAVALYFRMASFAENFQTLAEKEGFLTGNSKESKYAAKQNEEIQTGLRLKRLPPNYSRDLFIKSGHLDQWEGICGEIGLTVDVLSRPVGSVSEVVSVSRPMSAISRSSSQGGSRFN